MYIAAGQFKAKCLKLLDEKQLRKENIVITKHGKPVAKLVPFEDGEVISFGWMQGDGDVMGDIESTGESWDADQ